MKKIHRQYQNEAYNPEIGKGMMDYKPSERDDGCYCNTDKQYVYCTVSKPKDLEDVIMMSSASQIFLAKYSADEVGRAIEDMKELATAIRQWIRREVEGMKELHTHNSIPSYTADLDEGCSVCERNDALQDVIDKLCGK